MPTLKKRYRLTFDYEITVKDHKAIPVHRNEWPRDTPPHDIIERLKHVRHLLERLHQHPEVLEAYMRFRALTRLEDEVFDVKHIAEQGGVVCDGAQILAPVLDALDEDARRHFTQAQMEKGEYEGLVPFWEAFAERLVNVEIKEVETSSENIRKEDPS